MPKWVWKSTAGGTSTVRRSDPPEEAGLGAQQVIPAGQPAQRPRMGIPGAGLDRRVEDVHPRGLELAEIGLLEALGPPVPTEELRPVEGQEAEHVDRRRAQDEIGGAGRNLDGPEPDPPELEHRPPE